MKWIVGSTNPVKVQCVREAVVKCQSSIEATASAKQQEQHEFIGVSVPDDYQVPSAPRSMTTSVPPQPVDGQTTRLGAYRRALGALSSYDALVKGKKSAGTVAEGENCTSDDVIFGVGIEGGLEYWGDEWDSMSHSSCAHVDDTHKTAAVDESVLVQRHRWFESGWICIIERTKLPASESTPSCEYAYRQGWGSSARIEMSPAILRRMQLVVDEDPGRANMDAKQRLKALVELGPVMDDLFNIEKEQEEKTNAQKMKDCGQGIGAFGILTDGWLTRMEAYSHGVIFALSPWLSHRSVYWGEQ